MNNKTCFQCRYCRQHELSPAQQGAIKAGGLNRPGLCLRYPPTAVMMPRTVDKAGQIVRSKLQEPVGQTLVPDSIFPPVNEVTHACGEFAELLQ